MFCAASTTLNVPLVPVQMELSAMSSLKKATTGESLERPWALLNGTTVAAGMPAGAPESGG